MSLFLCDQKKQAAHIIYNLQGLLSSVNQNCDTSPSVCYDTAIIIIIIITLFFALHFHTLWHFLYPSADLKWITSCVAPQHLLSTSHSYFMGAHKTAGVWLHRLNGHMMLVLHVQNNIRLSYQRMSGGQEAEETFNCPSGEQAVDLSPMSTSGHCIESICCFLLRNSTEKVIK